MAFKITNKKGNIDAKQNVSNSEVDASTLDFSVDNEEGDIKAEQNINGVKSKKGWVMVLIALFIFLGQAGYNEFTEEPAMHQVEVFESTEKSVMHQDYEYEEPKKETIQDKIIKIVKLPFWSSPFMIGIFAWIRKKYLKFKEKK